MTNIDPKTVASFGDEWARFTRQQIAAMMERVGLVEVRLSDAAPYWCVVGVKQA